jgi:hypothetical protein
MGRSHQPLDQEHGHGSHQFVNGAQGQGSSHQDPEKPNEKPNPEPKVKLDQKRRCGRHHQRSSQPQNGRRQRFDRAETKKAGSTHESRRKVGRKGTNVFLGTGTRAPKASAASLLGTKSFLNPVAAGVLVGAPSLGDGSANLGLNDGVEDRGGGTPRSGLFVFPPGEPERSGLGVGILVRPGSAGYFTMGAGSPLI